MLELPSTPHAIANADAAPVFIIGTGRSGTTLLRQMLASHPRIHITHEAGFYSYAQHAARGSSPADWLERYFETFSFAWLQLDPQRVRDEIGEGLTWNRIADAYRAVMKCSARQQGKVRYGEKNPLDTDNLPRLFADFPDPRVIFMMRDPRPTVRSFDRMPFATGSTLLNSFLCKIQFDHIQPYLDRILEVKLEDLVASPRRVMQGVLNFVGEPWDDAVVDHASRVSTDVPPLPWFSGVNEKPNTNATDGGWREAMDPAWIRIVERINRRAMRRYGYADASLAREPSLFSMARALVRDSVRIAPAAYRILTFVRKLQGHFRGTRRLDAQRAMMESLSLNPAAWRYYPECRIPAVPRLPGARR